jgi:Na+/phosphate symporter
MEEKEMVQNLHGMFERAVPMLENMRQAFRTQNEGALTVAERTFVEIFQSNLPLAEAIIDNKEKNDSEKKFALLLIPLQKIASAIINIIGKRKRIMDGGLCFTDKAVNEVEDLFVLLEEQFVDTRDFIVTRNHLLKSRIEILCSQIAQVADRDAMEHQNRLITGLCSPRSSYYYLEIVDSFKNISRNLVDLSEKL